MKDGYSAKYAVHVPTEEKSRAVQERFFEMGIGWQGGFRYIDVNRYYRSRAAIGCRPGAISHCPADHFAAQEVPIFSTEEFLVFQSSRQTMFLKPKEV